MKSTSDLVFVVLTILFILSSALLSFLLVLDAQWARRGHQNIGSLNELAWFVLGAGFASAVLALFASQIHVFLAGLLGL